MAAAQRRAAYRSIIREVAKASISPRSSRNKIISSSFRVMFEQARSDEQTQLFEEDIQTAITFMRSQRMYKALLERYNPLVDLTSEERIQATARRVGLNMPVIRNSEEDK